MPVNRNSFRAFAALTAALLSSLAWSQTTQTYTFEVLVDADRSPATGCSVTPSGGATQGGFEHRLSATVVIGGGNDAVTAVERRECSGTGFGAPVAVTPPAPPWPVNFDGGVAGADAVELAVARGDVVDTVAGSIALSFVGDSGTGSDVMTTVDGTPTGAPIVLSFAQPPVNIPVLSLWGLAFLLVAVAGLAWIAHRRFGRIGSAMAVMLVATVVWAMNFAADGDLSDWAGLTPAGQDPTGDATDGLQAIDLVAAFAAFENDTLYFRIDAVDMETQPPTAIDDVFDALLGSVDSDAVAPGILGNDTLGVPEATLVDYGAPGTRGTLPGDPYTLPGSGGVTVTVAADGALTIDASAGTAIPGDYLFEYEIENVVGVDTAEVTVEVIDAPTAQPDVFTFDFNADQAAPASLFADNGAGADTLGTPAAMIATFGGGDLGASVADNAAGSAVPLAGGTLTVNDDGNWSLTGQPFDPGSYSFDYSLENAAGSDTATVTLNIQAPPDAVVDSYNATVGQTLNVPVATGVRNANDAWTLSSTPPVFPDATVSAFGDVGSPVVAPGNVYTLPASGGITVTLAADGSFVVDATAGSANPGIYQFEYVLANGTTDDSAIVTVDVREAPALQPDAFTFQADADQPTPPGLFTDNGAGPDELGTPAGTLTSFGGGDLGGSVGDNPAGSSVAFAGGTLTVNDDGGWSLTGQPFDPGPHTFEYQVNNAVGSDTATVTVNIQAAPQAAPDAFTVTLGSVDSGGSVLANDSPGVPPATVDFYADSGDIGGASQVAAPGIYTHPTGNFTVSIAGNGDITIDASVPGVTPNTYTFDYQITNSSGSSVATVTVQIVQAPAAVGDDFTVAEGTAVAFDAPAPQFNGQDLTADNGGGTDTTGEPPFDTVEFGGGDLGGAVGDNVVNSPGSVTVPFAAAGGDLTVASASAGALTFSLSGTTSGTQLIPGRYTFEYRLTNSVGTSGPATVTIEVTAPPTAVDDDPGASTAYVVPAGSSNTFPGASGVRDRNDDYTLPNVFPDATVSAYADVGDLGGPSEVAAGAPYTPPGSGGVTVTVSAAGDITIDATAGGAVAGDYSFEYALSNGTTDASAVVTFNVDAPPAVAQAEVEQNDPTDAFVTLPEQGGTPPVVTASPDLGFTFGESVTFNTGAFTVACGTSGDVTADYTASATPATSVGIAYTGSGLSPGETCTVRLVSDNIVDGQGNALDGDGNGASDGSPGDDELYDFVVDTAPGLVSVEVEVGDTFTPIPGAFGGAGGVINTDDDTTIRTTFDEAVNDNGGTTVTCDVSGAISTGGAGLSVAGNGSTQLTLSRTAGNFTAGETCTVTFNPPGLTDFDDADAPDTLTPPSPASYQFEVAPIAVDDGFAATTHLEARFDTVAPGMTNLLSNDLPAGASIAEVNGSAANVGVQFALGSGAFVTVEADGDVNYVPPPGATGGATDGFSYTLNAPNGSSATATVTMTMDGPVIWYVDADATGPIHNGTAAFPFDDLTGSGNDFDANAADAAGHTIFVYDSASDNSPIQCGLTLLNNQAVIGEGEAAGTLDVLTGRAPVAETVFAPDTTGAHPQLSSGGDCLTLGSGNTVRGLDIGDTTLGHAFVDGGATIGTATIADVGVDGAGGILSIVNGGTLNAGFNQTSANSAPDTEIELVNVSGTLDSAGGTINHSDAASGSVGISGGGVGGTIAASFNQTAGSGPLLQVQGGHTGTLTFSGSMTASAGTGLQFDNADGTYNLQGVLSITGGNAGINAVNGSDGALNVTSGSSSISGIQGIPFRVNSSTMAIDYDGDITHRQGVGSLLSARTVEIIGGTGTISLDGQVVAGDVPNPVTAETVYLENTGLANTITLNSVDATSNNTAVFRSLVSGDVAMNRLRLNCQGDLTIGGDTHCVQVSDTTSSGFTAEAMTADVDDAGENGGGLSLVNTPGTWTVEDISGGLAGLEQTTVFGRNFGTLNIATVNSASSPGGPATGAVTGANQPAFDLENGAINISAQSVTAFPSGGGTLPLGIRLVDTTGAGFEVTGDGAMTGGLLDRNGSGGTIQDTSGDGVFLSNASNVTLRQMNILDVGDSANNLDTDTTANDHAIESRGGGSVVLSAVHIRDPIGTGWEAFDINGVNRIDNGSLIEELDRTSNFPGLRVRNTDTSFTSFTIDSSTFDHKDPTPGDPATNGNAMIVLSTRGAVSGDWIASNNSFTGARGQAMTVAVGDVAGSTGTVNTTITNNDFMNAHPINGQNNMAITAQQNVTHNATVSGNTFFDVGRGASLSGQIIAQQSGSAQFDVTIEDNEIGGLATQNSHQQRGIDVVSLGTSTAAGSLSARVRNNTLFDLGRDGIFISPRGLITDFDVAVTNNTIGRDSSGAVDPVAYDFFQVAGISAFVSVASTYDSVSRILIDNNDVVVAPGDPTRTAAASAIIDDFNSGGSIEMNVTFEGNRLENTGDAGAANLLVQMRDSAGSNIFLNADVGNDAPNNVVGGGANIELREDTPTSGSVSIEDLANVAADNQSGGSSPATVSTAGTLTNVGAVDEPTGL